MSPRNGTSTTAGWNNNDYLLELLQISRPHPAAVHCNYRYIKDMDFASLTVISATLAGLVLSLLLIAGASNLAGKIKEMGATNQAITKSYLRLAGISGIVLCCISLALIVPATPYGKYLKGRYHFSRFLQSQSDEDADRAFRLWQEAKDKEAFVNALKKMPRDSSAWRSFIAHSSRLYYDREKPELFFQYLEGLETKIDHPRAKSTIQFELGSAYLGIDPIKAERHFDMVLSLGSDPEAMERARGNIHEIHNLTIGAEAPDFTLTTTEGQTFTRSSLLGKIILLEFWSMHCKGCIAELPILRNIHDETTGSDFVMIGISLDAGEDVKSFIAANTMPWHNVMVDQKISSAILDSFNIQYIPSNYVIDKDGKIVLKKLRGEKLKESVQQLLGKS